MCLAHSRSFIAEVVKLPSPKKEVSRLPLPRTGTVGCLQSAASCQLCLHEGIIRNSFLIVRHQGRAVKGGFPMPAAKPDRLLLIHGTNAYSPYDAPSEEEKARAARPKVGDQGAPGDPKPKGDEEVYHRWWQLESN